MSVSRSRTPGFTLVELMVVVALIGVLAALSLTSYLAYVEKARVARAIAEIKSIATVIEALMADESRPMPDSLAEVEIDTPDDPWGNPYQYLRIEGVSFARRPGGLPAVAAAPPPGGGGGALDRPRQDQFLRPVNSDFDLYSMGPDGETQFVMSSATGRDDIVRALDGAFIGIAWHFEAK